MKHKTVKAKKTNANKIFKCAQDANRTLIPAPKVVQDPKKVASKKACRGKVNY